MKLLIASDIHGSAAYCRDLMLAIEKETPDKVLLLGDLLYHGPTESSAQGVRSQGGGADAEYAAGQGALCAGEL